MSSFTRFSCHLFLLLAVLPIPVAAASPPSPPNSDEPSTSAQTNPVAPAADTSGGPVTRVLALLQQLRTTAQNEIQAADVAFARFQQAAASNEERVSTILEDAKARAVAADGEAEKTANEVQEVAVQLEENVGKGIIAAERELKNARERRAKEEKEKNTAVRELDGAIEVVGKAREALAAEEGTVFSSRDLATCCTTRAIHDCLLHRCFFGMKSFSTTFISSTYCVFTVS